MVILDVCICIIILLIGFNLKNLFSDFSTKDRSILNKLFFYHYLIAIVFHFYVQANGGDAIYYWNEPKTASFSELLDLAARGSASGVMCIINYIPSRLLDLSFFTGNMFYALIGYCGFLYLYRLTTSLFPEDKRLSEIKLMKIPVFPWILFLPNFHFWSSGIGKDSLLFFCIILFIYALQNWKKRIFGIVISILVSIIIRPHITLFLLIAFGFGYVVDGKLKAYQKGFIFLVFAIGFISIFDYVMQFVQLESLESTAIEEYTATKATVLNQDTTGSGVDISSYPLPLKIFTFLYRPLFFDINGPLAIIASIENLLLLLFTVKIFFSRPISLIRRSDFLIKGMLIYFLMGAVAFSLILGNLGIMLRQKNMFMPLLVIIGLWIMYHRNNIKKTKLS